MISDHIAVQAVSRSTSTSALHWGRWPHPLSTLAARIPLVTAALASFAKVPLLPYADLWASSVLVGLIKDTDRVDSDSLPQRTSILGDDRFWSHF
jgi:hypothetical protein